MTIARRYGWLACIVTLMCDCLNQIMYFKVLKGMTLTTESVDKRYLDPHPKYPGDIVAGGAIRSLISRESQITDEFIQGALARRDWASVLRDGELVASSGWYSKESVPIDEYFSIRFSDQYTYMYKGFTSPDHRGEYLHAYGMAQALVKVADDGKRGLISYVEVDNLASLRSCVRLGYKIFSSCILLRVFGKSYVMRSPACRHFDFGVIKRF